MFLPSPLLKPLLTLEETEALLFGILPDMDGHLSSEGADSVGPAMDLALQGRTLNMPVKAASSAFVSI